MPKIRQTNKVMKVGNQWLPAFLNSVNGSPTYTYMNDSGQWTDASGNTYNVEHPLDEVTVMPGEFKEQNSYVNKLRDDYSQALFNYNKINNPKTQGLEMAVGGFLPTFTIPGAASMIVGYGADEFLKHTTGKSFDQYGRGYITPYLQKLGMASDIAGDVGGFLGNMTNPGYWVGGKIPGFIKKGLYNGMLWDKYTDFSARFGNWSKNPITNAYASMARNFGLPDVSRLPGDLFRKINSHARKLDNGMLDFTGGKGWNNQPHTNFTLDRPVVSHRKGDWTTFDTYILNGQQVLKNAGNSLKSIDPSDVFINGQRINVDPKSVVLISGNENSLQWAKNAGIRTLSSPKLRDLYQQHLDALNVETTPMMLGRFDIGRNPRKVHANEYSSEVQRLASRRGTPRIGDMRLLEKQTGLDSKTYGVFKGNVIKNAMKLAAHGYGLNTNVFGYGIPEKQSAADYYARMMDKEPYYNIFYNPASPTEAIWRKSFLNQQ